jgi:hypothetical protein
MYYTNTVIIDICKFLYFTFYYVYGASIIFGAWNSKTNNENEMKCCYYTRFKASECALFTIQA